MALKEDILAICDRKIEGMKNSPTPEKLKEELIEGRKLTKVLLEIVCDTPGMEKSAAVRCLSEAREIIEEASSQQKI